METTSLNNAGNNMGNAAENKTTLVSGYDSFTLDDTQAPQNAPNNAPAAAASSKGRAAKVAGAALGAAGLAAGGVLLTSSMLKDDADTAAVSGRGAAPSTRGTEGADAHEGPETNGLFDLPETPAAAEEPSSPEESYYYADEDVATDHEAELLEGARVGTDPGMVYDTTVTEIDPTEIDELTTTPAEAEEFDPVEAEAPATSSITDLPMATTVDDSMSFNQAFAAARAELGAGGVFEWHGKLYGTYYKDEWDSMSAADRAEYNSHFNWGASAHDDATAEAVADDGGDVEVLGALPEDEYDINELEADSEQVFFIDVDGDGEFDYAMNDFNGDGVISSDEIIDLVGDSFDSEDVAESFDGDFDDIDI